MDELGARIRDYREAHFLSVRAMADMAMINKSVIHRVELGLPIRDSSRLLLLGFLEREEWLS